jgi:hypothetical protein
MSYPYQNNFNKFNKYPNNNNGGYNKFNNQKNISTEGGSNYSKNDEPLPDPKFYKAYVGTGNKDAPPEIIGQIKRLASELETFGFTVRVSGGDGCDETFEASAKDVELHLPWKGFAGKQSKSTFNSPMAKAIARMFHPAYDGLNFRAQGFLAKNVRLVLGKDLNSYARFVLCWSEDGCESGESKTSKTGFVGHTIAIASGVKIPVFNLAKPDAEKRLKQYLGMPYEQKQAVQEF